jgi:hypothetical protein
MSEDKKVFRVVVVYEFEGIEDPNGLDADMVVDEVAKVTGNTLTVEWASSISGAAVWIEDAYVAKGIWSVSRKKAQEV